MHEAEGPFIRLLGCHMPEVFRCLLLLLYVLLIHDLDLDAFKQGLALSEILSDLQLLMETNSNARGLL